MPPLPTLPGVFQVVLMWTFSGATAQNRLHIMSSTPTAEGLYGILNSLVTPAMWQQAPGGARVDRVRITELDGESNAFEQATVGPQWATSSAAGSINMQVAAVMTLRTAKRGKQNNGRTYLPWVGEEQNVNGALDPTVVTGLQTAWDAFRTGLPTSGSSLQIASYGVFTDADPPVVIPGKEPRANAVTSITVHTQVGTIRQRAGRYYV